MSIRFLALSEVVLINRDQVIRFGGLLGIRVTGLLDSAVHAPQASFLACICTRIYLRRRQGTQVG